MGITVEISSLEEMCDLMCNNAIPKQKKKWYYFTFGADQEHAGHYIKLWGTFDSTRRAMFDIYGTDWAFQYSEEEWEEMKADPDRPYPLETELKSSE